MKNIKVMKKESLKFYVEKEYPITTKRFLGQEMHSDVHGDVFKYRNCDEKAVKDDIVYKVWCLVNGPREGGDYAIYTVLYFEEVPQEILEIEKRIESDTKRLRQYWQSMDC